MLPQRLLTLTAYELCLKEEQKVTDEKKERKKKRISQCYGCGGQRPMRCDNSCTCKCARSDCKLVVGEEGLPSLILEGGIAVFAVEVAGIVYPSLAFC
jgi:hypothetical protein